jgi:hypothetical protein
VPPAPDTVTLQQIIRDRLDQGLPVPDGIEQLLADAQSGNALTRLGTERVIRAILHNVGGVANVEAVGRPYTMPNGKGSDLDIFLRDGTLIKVGGNDKADESRFGAQLAGYKDYAQQHRRPDGSVPDVYFMYDPGTDRSIIRFAQQRRCCF